MPPRKLRSPLALVVLGLLAQESLHPYAIRVRIGQRAHDRLPGVRLPSLYDVVQRLDGAGLIRAGEPGRAGRRPERIPYLITAPGREALTEWVAESLADLSRSDEFPAALSFMYVLGRDRVVEILHTRTAELAASLEADEAALAQAEMAGTAPIFLSEHRYQLALRRAQRDWLADFTEAVGAGTLRWPGPPRED